MTTASCLINAVDKIGASTYFRLTALPDTYDEALLAIETGSADVVLGDSRDFEKDWVKERRPACWWRPMP